MEAANVYIVLELCMSLNYKYFGLTDRISVPRHETYFLYPNYISVVLFFVLVRLSPLGKSATN
jgi:hypothetical protein